MISYIFKKLTGRHYRKYLNYTDPIVARINELEIEYQNLTEEALKAKTAEFKQRYKDGETLDDLLPEAFAAVKNTARRLVGQKIMVMEHELTWDMVHFDVQLIGGIALHENKIAEMATGEGKTLVSTLPMYLNALTGRNCQLVTTNEYLAQRDSEWMGYIYNYLGLSVGVLKNQQPPSIKREMYNKDITYGTASEFGFDYLRDNGMATRAEDQVQRDHYYVIVDEVDSILVDEARTPLIISGPVKLEREMPFDRFKGPIQRIVSRQTRFCNELINEARKAIREERESGETEVNVLSNMLMVKLGMPKNKQFLRLMEDGSVRKEFEKYDLEMSGDLNKDKKYRLKEELYFVIDEKGHSADLTEKGRNFLRPENPDAFTLPDLPTTYMEIDKNSGLNQQEKDKQKAAAQDNFENVSEEIHCISQLLRAYSLYEKDVEYVVVDGKVIIIDENTGRSMPGRRWSDGLHQAVEAKENVAIEKETKTYATITIQNYFRMYDKLAGMTGTAETEANEFRDIYKLDVMVIPTNRPCQRIDHNDVIYKTRREKYNAVIEEIRAALGRGQPVLVGTTSVESSEVLSRLMRRANITHSVLNAKYHEREADIIARAGQRGMVTIATNMAGRGTDIKLGEGVADVGGLYVIGTERHTSRRIDRQLRGRCARQGDPGSSKFFLSLEDDLMRLYSNQGFAARVLEGAFVEGEPLQHRLLNPAIERAQKSVEQHHYSMRKRLLQYDDVLNKQREVVYVLRNNAIHHDTPKDTIFELVDEELEVRMDEAGCYRSKVDSDSAIETLLSWVNKHFPVALRPANMPSQNPDEVHATILESIHKAYATKESVEDPDALRMLERYVIIKAIDRHWQDHLTAMEDLRQSVSLRSYGQKDPLNEYKSEAYRYFEKMMEEIRSVICSGLFRSATNLQAFENMLSMLSKGAQATGPSESDIGSVTVLSSGGAATAAERKKAAAGGGPGAGKGKANIPKITIKRNLPKVGRNDPCPCGSGKKFKKCCGR